MTIKEEFSEACLTEATACAHEGRQFMGALFGALWMAERLAVKREENAPHCCEDCPCSYWPEEIRKLAKELKGTQRTSPNQNERTTEQIARDISFSEGQYNQIKSALDTYAKRAELAEKNAFKFNGLTAYHWEERAEEAEEKLIVKDQRIKFLGDEWEIGKAKLSEAHSLIVEKDKALEWASKLKTRVLGQDQNGMVKTEDYEIEGSEIVKKALSLTPADIRSQLEEAQETIGKLSLALSHIKSWLVTVKESGIRYVSLGAESLLIQHKDALSLPESKEGK